MIGTATGATSTIASCYAMGINPFNGSKLSFSYKNQVPQRTYNFGLDEHGDNVTLYRGTTGSEKDNGFLFMTDNPEYAASYVKNGGSVEQITISRTTLKQMFHNGDLTYNSGYYTKGNSTVPYMNINLRLMSNHK